MSKGDRGGLRVNQGLTYGKPRVFGTLHGLAVDVVISPPTLAVNSGALAVNLAVLGVHVAILGSGCSGSWGVSPRGWLGVNHGLTRVKPRG